MAIRVRNFDWLATIFYPLAVILMEACWVYPWLVWLGSFPVFSHPRPALSLVSVVIVLAAATLSIRLFLRQKWSVTSIQAAVVCLGLIVILIVLGIDYNAGYGFLSGQWFAYVGQVFGNLFTRPDTMAIAVPALLYLWWRGTNLGQTTSYFQNIYRSFLLGMAALILLLIIWQVSAASGNIPGPGTGIGLDIIVFFFFGLLAIAISHLYTMRNSMPREEAGRTPAWRWLPIMLAVIGGMAVFVFAIAGAFSPGFFTTVGHGFGVILDFLWKIFNYILIPFNFIFEGIFWVVRWLINLLRSNQPNQPNNADNMSMGNIFGQTTSSELPAWILLTIKWLVIAVIAAIVIFILARAVSRFRARRAAEEIDEIHESIFSWRGLGKDLRELLGMLGKKQKKPAALRPKYDIDADESRRMDIREIYWRLLREASLSGIGRSIQETPMEYSQRLSREMPAGSDTITQLTDMYSDVRYGEIHLPEEKVTISNSMWWELFRTFRVWRGRF
jgi:hypothetical protein